MIRSLSFQSKFVYDNQDSRVNITFPGYRKVLL